MARKGDKLEPKLLGPAKIEKSYGKGVYKLVGVKQKYNADFLERYQPEMRKRRMKQNKVFGVVSPASPLSSPSNLGNASLSHSPSPAPLQLKKRYKRVVFLNSGMRGEIWYQYRHIPSGKGSA
ncbi:MAG: hypothetical protein GY820_01820 [Gammaproteobacteria bacterium]|nr:hypothetical protein [Gammaproteobacteria bacterium]